MRDYSLDRAVDLLNRGFADYVLPMLRALLARYPLKTWRVPALCPEEAGGPFARVGFERGSLSQYQMIRGWA